MKAMKTPAAKAKGMKPETKTMKAMKTPAAKAKGMNPKTLPLARMKTPAAKAQEMKPDTATEIIIDGAIRLTTPMSPCEILRCLLPPRRRVGVRSERAGWKRFWRGFKYEGAGEGDSTDKRRRSANATPTRFRSNWCRAHAP